MNMRVFLDNVCRYLLRYGADKYVHAVVASIIAAAVIVAVCWLPWWACMMVSVLATSALICVKEWLVDDDVDVVDIVFGYVGALIVWLVFVTSVLAY